MRRLVRGDIRVTLRPSGNAPASFVWERRQYEVEKVLLVWKIAAAWWDGEGERTCFRVSAAAGEESGLFELAYDHEERAWILTRVLD